MGVELALPRFYKLTKPWLRTTEEGADTIVWLAAVDKPPSSGAFVFDRAEASRHMLPSTREDVDERLKLWSKIEAHVAAS